MTIVVVDDEQPIMQLCVKVLETEGHSVDGFTRPEDALERLAAGPADLLVADYRMPGVGGIELVRRARALQPDLRVVMITGHGTREVVDEAHAAGAEVVLLKPFTPGELVGTVASLSATPPAPR